MSLTEQGYAEMPGPLGDWLLAIHDTVQTVQADRTKKAEQQAKSGRRR